MYNISFFDFDKTIIAVDSFMAIIKVGIRQSIVRILLFVFVLLFIYPLFAICIYLCNLDKSYVKSIFLWVLTVGKTKKECVIFLKNTAQKGVQNYWFKEADAYFNDFIKNNVQICCVSASGTLWVRYLLKQKYPDYKFLVIGSKLKFFLGGVVISGKNCYNIEKIKRINEYFNFSSIEQSNFKYKILHSFSDHPADIPLLLLGEKISIINPKHKHKKLFSIGLSRKFVIEHWTY